MFENGNICMITLDGGAVKFAHNMGELYEKEAAYRGRIKGLISVRPNVEARSLYL